MRFSAFLGVAIALSALTPVAANASTALTKVGLQGTSPFNIVKTGPSPLSEAVQAGNLMMSDGSSSFIAFCLDIYGSWTGGEFDKKGINDSIFAGGPSLSDTVKDDIQAFYDQNYGTVLSAVDAYDNNSSSSNLTARNNYFAAFQLGLWEIVFEKLGTQNDSTTETYNISDDGDDNSGFYVSSGNSTVLGFAQAFLNNVGDGITNAFKLDFWDALQPLFAGDANPQDLVSGNPNDASQDVPIPGAAWFLGSGLLGLFSLSRMKKKAAV